MKISIIIPVYNGKATLERCLQAVRLTTYPDYECIVVDDGGSTDGSLEIARRLATRVLALAGGPRGPAHARNQGAQAASGEVVFFVDADVIIRPETVGLVGQTFEAHPEYTAMFGSYDVDPGDAEFLSQFKNLFHHYVHQRGNTEAGTFWSGCGAMRREAFLRLGGFDIVRYPRPSIEDIELGMRLRAGGGRIYINKAVQVQHLKRWTLGGLIRTDIFDRGIPWTLLILQAKNLPNDLNLNPGQRLSAILLTLLLGLLLLGSFYQPLTLVALLAAAAFILIAAGWPVGARAGSRRPDPAAELGGLAFLAAAVIVAFFSLAGGALGAWPLMAWLALAGLAAMGLAFSASRVLSSAGQRPVFALFVSGFYLAAAAAVGMAPLWVSLPALALLAALIGLNLAFYRFFHRLRGLAFALAAAPFHFLYYLYSLVALAGGVSLHMVRRFPRPGAARQ